MPPVKKKLPWDEVEAAIVRLDEAVQAFNESSLTRAALIALIVEFSKPKLSKSTVATVLDALEHLRANALKPDPKNPTQDAKVQKVVEGFKK